MHKIKDKNILFTDLKKQIDLKNEKIETVFHQAIPMIHKFKIEYLSVRDFFNVFIYAGCKSASEDKIRELL